MTGAQPDHPSGAEEMLSDVHVKRIYDEPAPATATAS